MTIENENLSEIIAEIRSHLLDLYAKNKELYDENDIERIRNEDRLIERDYLFRKSVKDSKEMMAAAMRFRKEMGAPKLKATDFPIEFHKLAIVFPYGYDKYGNGLIYLRPRLFRRIKEFEQLFRKFVLYQVEDLDKKTNQNGMALIMDLRSTGFANVDMEFMLFFLKVLLQYFPYLLNYVYVYQMPFLFRSIWYAIYRLLPSEHVHKVKMITDKDIFDHIDRKNVPLFMGGLCKKNFYYLPENCITPVELGFSEKEFYRHLKFYKNSFEECEKERKQLVKYEMELL
ncbi:hypothetical protein BLA29_002903 [Euroglyphus maynei]|uniref:CRAL-TRIO domain-containing protein n=1 Tax=Euroglyphus maynei TaxID=6958 RepID=A0A1Y3AT48_EURMA|nr:hypothetical protein BLA29_002903 [Euroglyphus maynei]